MATCEQDRSGPVRMCAGCRSRRAASELIRLTGTDGRVVPDLERALGGRGVHLCVSRGCVKSALKRGALTRALGFSARLSVDELCALLETALRTRLDSYMRSALRSEPYPQARKSGVGPREASESAPRGPRTARTSPGDHVQARAHWLRQGVTEFTSTSPGANNPPPCRDGAYSAR